MSSAKIVISLDPKKCSGYGNCVPIMPEVFQLERGQKLATLLRSEVSEDEREDIEEAMRSCPARAIKIKSVD